MRVIVGRIGRPHGIRGEVVIGVRTDEPDLRFAVGAVLYVDPTLAAVDGRSGPGGPRGSGGDGFPPGSGGSRGVAPPGPTLQVASARWHSGHLLVAFTGITDRTEAGELTGSWLSVDSGQLPEVADPDEFRDHELVGLSVRTTTGDPVGVVTDVRHYGQDLLVVRGQENEELLVPFVKEIVPEVDLTTGVLVIDPPPGLLDPGQAE